MRIKDIVFLSMLSALAFVLAVAVKIPIMPSAPFLKFDVKDAVILIGGLIYGPAAALLVSFIAALLQMMLTGESGVIGFVMNLLSTASFVCTASAVYKFNRTRRGLAAGLAVGCVLMTASMLLWNYIVTPIFMGVPRKVVASMLFTVFMPFNLIKGGINSVIVLLYLSPLLRAMSATQSRDEAEEHGHSHSDEEGLDGKA